MQAIVVREHGGPEVLRSEQAPEPQHGDGEVNVRVESVGVNFIDVYFRTGLYPTALPFTPGQEAAGVVEAVGAEAGGFEPGDRVGWAGVTGAYAERAVVPAAKLVRLPAGVTTQQAAAVLLQGMTAHYLVNDTWALKPGDTCLVHAAAGGVGQLLVQMARARGARVLATAGTPEKLALAQAAGADAVIAYAERDFATEVGRLTEGRGVEVVYDGVGRATWEGSLACLAPRGLLVLFGNASGAVPPIDPLLLSKAGSVFLTRPTLFHHIATRPDLERRAGEVLAAVADGRLAVQIGAEFALAQAAQAHAALEGRQTTGKVLLRP